MVAPWARDDTSLAPADKIAVDGTSVAEAALEIASKPESSDVAAEKMPVAPPHASRFEVW